MCRASTPRVQTQTQTQTETPAQREEARERKPQQEALFKEAQQREAQRSGGSGGGGGGTRRTNVYTSPSGVNPFMSITAGLMRGSLAGKMRNPRNTVLG